MAIIINTIYPQKLEKKSYLIEVAVSVFVKLTLIVIEKY